MKHKRQSKDDKEGNWYLDFDEIYVDRHLPPFWWLHPTFDFGLKYPMPYIWFAFWLITWEEDDLWHDTFRFSYKIGSRWYAARKGFQFLRIHISFMPD